MKCGVASRYCRRLQIKYPISLFATNQPIHSPFLPSLLVSSSPHRVPFCNVNHVHNVHAPQRLRLITIASVCSRVRECCTSTMPTTTTTTTMAATTCVSVVKTFLLLSMKSCHRAQLKRAVLTHVNPVDNPFNPSILSF